MLILFFLCPRLEIWTLCGNMVNQRRGLIEQRLNCKLCGKDMMGGITQLKYHLAQISGHEVGICPKIRPKIIHIANESLVDMGISRDIGDAMRVELRKGGVARSEGGRSDSVSDNALNVLIFFCS
jgi:hypothetical protein